MTEFPARNFSLASVKRLLHQTDIQPGLQTASQAVVDVALHAVARTLNLLKILRLVKKMRQERTELCARSQEKLALQSRLSTASYATI